MYARNTDKNIIYMVYTGGGRYQAVALFPGPYEVWVEKTGFESDRQEIQIDAGEHLNVDFSLTESGPQSAGQGSFMCTSSARMVYFGFQVKRQLEPVLIGLV